MEQKLEMNLGNHELKLSDRSRIVLTGIKKIVNFDSQEFLMETTLGVLELKGTGLELFDDYNADVIKNPYDVTRRKYEIFNETLDDIFAIEANELLQKEGIYLFEPEKFTDYDVKDNNTSSITKEILRPLLTKYRSQVIRALMYGNREELIRYIGRENFEELNDVVNKVDYLSRNVVMSKLETSPDDEMVKEYYEQVERAKKIYENIDIYYKNNVDNYMSYYDEVSVKK